jgi:hypothetical protein
MNVAIGRVEAFLFVVGRQLLNLRRCKRTGRTMRSGCFPISDPRAALSICSRACLRLSVLELLMFPSCIRAIVNVLKVLISRWVQLSAEISHGGQSTVKSGRHLGACSDRANRPQIIHCEQPFDLHVIWVLFELWTHRWFEPKSTAGRSDFIICHQRVNAHFLHANCHAVPYTSPTSCRCHVPGLYYQLCCPAFEAIFLLLQHPKTHIWYKIVLDM